MFWYQDYFKNDVPELPIYRLCRDPYIHTDGMFTEARLRRPGEIGKRPIPYRAETRAALKAAGVSRASANVLMRCIVPL